MKNNISKQSSYLWWVDPDTQKSTMAGVAYYDEERNDYQLKVNIFPNLRLFLKMIKTEGERIIYRVEQVKSHQGRVISRFSVGTGESNPNNNHSVYMNIGPMKYLVLKLQTNENEKALAA